MNSGAHDVIVAGLGAAGSATAWRLALRGARVLGLDRFHPPHGHSAHHGATRGIRFAYPQGGGYVPLATLAGGLWRELEAVSGEQLLTLTGNLTVGHAGSAAIDGALATARAQAIAHELLEAETIRERHPDLAVPQGFRGFYEPGAGLLAPEACVAAMLGQAERLGAELHFDETLMSWRETDAGVEVTTNRGTYAAGALVLACGPRLRGLLGPAPYTPTPRRVAVHYFRTAHFRAPINFWQLADGREFYLVPEPGRVKVAFHHPLPAGDPDQPTRPGTGDEAALRKLLGRYVPGLGEAELERTETCFYATTDDGDFLLGPLPGCGRLFLGAFAGHGFKFAPAVGEVMADLALDGASEYDLHAFDPGRFS
jgi:sarcosine oxidase